MRLVPLPIPTLRPQPPNLLRLLPMRLLPLRLPRLLLLSLPPRLLLPRLPLQPLPLLPRKTSLASSPSWKLFLNSSRRKWVVVKVEAKALRQKVAKVVRVVTLLPLPNPTHHPPKVTP